MADCPYARCMQERKHIRRELLRWTKNMVFVVGLERVAEELMGRRRWKQYQDTLYSSSCSTENTSTAASQQQQQLQLQIQQLAQQVQQAKPKDSPTLPLKASITSHQQPPRVLDVTNSAPGTGSVSPRRADETSLVVTAGSENGRFSGEATRENGAISTSENGVVDEQQLLLEDGKAARPERIEDDEASRIKRERLDETIRSSSLREEQRSEHSKTNETAGTKEGKEETVLERIQLPHGLLRVKKEEELQETPASEGGLGCPSRPTSTPLIINSNGLSAELLCASTSPKKEVIFCTPTYILGRRSSPPPEDWKPLDKCYFCLDGKLPHTEQPPLSPQSDSTNSSRSAESPMPVQVDPMAASVMAAALSGTYPTLLPQWCLPPREPPPVAAVTQQQHQENAGVDQPLDLSAKPKNSQENNLSILEQQKIPLRIAAAIDPKTIFNSSCYRAKPRVTGGVTATGVPVVGTGGAGRRTYTEDELQAALRDIQSGKLGTRRAAVLYGIPRSTLRNKVYKLAMERDRDASLSAGVNAAATPGPNPTAQSTHNEVAGPSPGPGSNAQGARAVEAAATALATTIATITTTTTTTTTTTFTTPNTTRQNVSATTPLPQVDEVDDRELSGAEEEKEVEKALLKPLLSLEDLVRFSSLEGGGAGDSLRALLQRGQDTGATEWSAFDHPNIGPYIQKMLATAAPFKGHIGFEGMEQDYRIPEVVCRLMNENKKLKKEINVNGEQVQQVHHMSLQHRLSQSAQRAPMTNDDFNPTIEEEASDSGQGRAILKIPSYKPASSGPSKNGSDVSGPGANSAFAQSFAATGSPALLERASPAFSGTSSPTNSLVGKGMTVNFRDVIAKSISVKFQEGQQQASIPGSPSSQAMITEPNPYKRGRYTPPQQPQAAGAQSQQSQQQKSSAQSQDKQHNKPSTGGKGTRPKRGKYRNYDRDSLVEAVRAVQRGEMSVHRAGSYYGVPHSTLEYKVKERHLMRPRKRDQKQPDDKVKEPMVSSTTLRPAATVTPEKKQLLKPQKPFTPAASNVGIPGPNGLKMSPFIEGMPHLPFAHPFNFWGPTPFIPGPFIPTGGPNVPAILPEQYFASQRIRGLQEQQRNAIVQQQKQQQHDSTSTEQSGTSNTRTASMTKMTREMADNLYDGTTANGSFLDNLIRSSLESGMPRDRAIAEARSNTTQTQQHKQPDNLGNSKMLIDQLCRNARRTPLPRPMQQDSSDDDTTQTNYRSVSATQQRPLPERPERVPTVDLSPSPSERTQANDEGSELGLASPPTPLSLSRLSGSGKEDETIPDSRSSREREVLNGGSNEMVEDRQDFNNKKLNHYLDICNLYAVSTDKKSACDSKLIVDHLSQKTQQQKDYTATVGGLVEQLQSNYNSSSVTTASTTAGDVVVVNAVAIGNGRSATPKNQSSQEIEGSPDSPLPATTTTTITASMEEESVEQ